VREFKDLAREEEPEVDVLTFTTFAEPSAGVGLLGERSRWSLQSVREHSRNVVVVILISFDTAPPRLAELRGASKLAGEETFETLVEDFRSFANEAEIWDSAAEPKVDKTGDSRMVLELQTRTLSSGWSSGADEMLGSLSGFEIGWETCDDPSKRVFERPDEENLEGVRLGLRPGKPDRERDENGGRME